MVLGTLPRGVCHMRYVVALCVCMHLVADSNDRLFNGRCVASAKYQQDLIPQA